MGGASMFLYPDQYVSILSIMSGMDLRPHHVVVTEAFLPLLYSEISAIPSKRTMRPSSVQSFALVDGDNGESVCVVEHGFYNSTPRHFLPSSSVTQSTSELAPNRVVNIR